MLKIFKNNFCNIDNWLPHIPLMITVGFLLQLKKNFIIKKKSFQEFSEIIKQSYLNETHKQLSIIMLQVPDDN